MDKNKKLASFFFKLKIWLGSSESESMRLFIILTASLLISCSEKTQFQLLASQAQIFPSHLADKEGFEKESFQLKSKKAQIDILVVADTSGSMYHHLNRLGQSLSSLLSVISNYDWQIGITLADHGDHQNPGALQKNWKDYALKQAEGRFGSLMPLENGHRLLNSKILNPKTPHYEKVFLHSLSHTSGIDCDRPPYCSNYLEQPLRSLQSAIKRSVLDNQEFFRPQADFVSLIITNEEERSEDPSRATSAEEVLDSFSEHFSNTNKKYIAYNIIVQDSACLKSEMSKGGTAHIALSIAQLAKLTGGSNVSLCAQNYDSELRKISQDIKHELENRVSLKKEPLPESVKVHFLEGPPLKWRLSGRNIIFENESANSSSIVVIYQEKKRFL